jgi:hypothetical protein
MLKTSLFLTALLVVTYATSSFSTVKGPHYASKETLTIIQKMLKAHGGFKPWSNKSTVGYVHTYVGPQDPGDPWTSEEIVEQGTRRVYQNWQLDEAKIIYNGEAYYGVNWKRGNPPKFTAHLAYYFGNLPFLTQDEGVTLTATGKASILEGTEEYLTVKMTFDKGTGESSDDYYELYIDEKTFMLKAVKYIMTYGALLDAFELPADVKFLGPFYKYYEDYVELDGLIVPSKLTTRGTEGEDYGYHIYENWTFNKTFNENLMTIPDNAIMDTSSATRKSR